jgi:hypothetical protein
VYRFKRHGEKLKSNISSILSPAEIESIHSWVAQFRRHWYKTPIHKSYDAKKALKLNYKIIGSGFNRIVYDLNNGYVLKVALSPEGFISNENEYDVYLNCDDELKRHLCPVKESGHGWIIMKKMKPKLSRAVMESHKLIQLQLKFLRYGIIPIDLRHANVAYSEENEMVVIDYGLFSRGFRSPLRFVTKLL